MFDVHSIRADFPILHQRIHHNPLVYFDNAATTQKPQVVIDEICRVYTQLNSNIHRGVHFLSQQTTEAYEHARRTIQQFIHAEFSQEIIFTSGTTGGINLVAFSFGERYVREGDEILISAMEHHSNLVPWQLMCQRKKARLKVIPLLEDGTLNMEEYYRLLSGRTRLVAVTHASNVLGTINPIKEIIDTAHKHGAFVLIDGAQSVQHIPIHVQELDCDFFVFSGHKLYGPTGTGILYGKHTLLNEMPPYQGGGEMVSCVTFEHTTFNELPFKFEAGTTHYAGAIGMAKAIEYLQKIGLNNIATYEQELLQYLTLRMKEIKGIRIFGQAPQKVPVVSFLIEGVHQYDTGMVLDKMGIAVRTGTHCAQPVMDIYGVEGTVRASLSFYNTREEIDRLIEGILRVKKMFLSP